MAVELREREPHRGIGTAVEAQAVAKQQSDVTRTFGRSKFLRLLDNTSKQTVSVGNCGNTVD